MMVFHIKLENSFFSKLRAKVNNETDGFVKILAESKSDRVLG